MIPCLIKKELEFMKEEKCFPQRHHYKVIHQIKDFLKFFAVLIKNYSCWMDEETNKLSYLHAIKNNECVLNLFPSLKFRDYCFMRKIHSWKDLIN